MAKKYRSKKGRTGWWRATACARATPRTTGRTTPAATAPIGGRWGARPRAATAPRRPPPRLEPAPVRRPPFRAPSFENQTVHRFRHQVKLDIKSNPPHQLEPSTSVLRREWIRKLICVPFYWWFFFSLKWNPIESKTSPFQYDNVKLHTVQKCCFELWRLSQITELNGFCTADHCAEWKAAHHFNS